MDCDCDFYFSPVKAEKSHIDNFKVLFEDKENDDECIRNVAENEMTFGKGNCDASPYYQILKKKIEEKQKDKTKGNGDGKRKDNKKHNNKGNNVYTNNATNNNKLKRSIKEIKNKEKKKA